MFTLESYGRVLNLIPKPEYLQFAVTFERVEYAVQPKVLLVICLKLVEGANMIAEQSRMDDDKQ